MNSNYFTHTQDEKQKYVILFLTRKWLVRTYNYQTMCSINWKDENFQEFDMKYELVLYQQSTWAIFIECGNAEHHSKWVFVQCLMIRKSKYEN